MMRKSIKLLIALWILAIVGALVFPIRTGRDTAAAAELVSNLRELSSQIESDYFGSGELPLTQSDIDVDDELQADLEDRSYSYTKISSQSYELCADFPVSSEDLDTKNDLSFYGSALIFEEFEEGTSCETVDVFGGTFSSEPEIDFDFDDFDSIDIQGLEDLPLDDLDSAGALQLFENLQ